MQMPDEKNVGSEIDFWVGIVIVNTWTASILREGLAQMVSSRVTPDIFR